LKTLALSLVLLTAATAAAQTNPSQDELNELMASLGSPTFLEEFVAKGNPPDEDALDEFLSIAGFTRRPTDGGCCSLKVTYGGRPTIVHARLTDHGAQLTVYLEQSRTTTVPRRKRGLEPWLGAPEPGAGGVFSQRGSGLGVSLATRGLTDLMLHRAIRTLIANAERAAAIVNR
jgi:hypothetical protein